MWLFCSELWNLMRKGQRMKIWFVQQHANDSVYLFDNLSKHTKHGLKKVNDFLSVSQFEIKSEPNQGGIYTYLCSD